MRCSDGETALVSPVGGRGVRRSASTAILGAVVGAALLAGCGGASDRFVDPRDGHAYSRVKIGNATWMGENLAWEAPAGSFCYQDDPANCAPTGFVSVDNKPVKQALGF
jgi:hypothetical protein